MDTHLVETLNRWFAANAFRADLCRALAIVPLVLIAVLVVVAWSTPGSNSPIGRSELLLGVLAAVGALLLNLALGHLYYRARPFLVLDVRPLLPEAVDSSVFSDHLAVAGAVFAALFVARRTLGWSALGLGVLLAIGRVGAGVQYPSDCLVGAAVGTACFLVLLPLRSPSSRAIAAAVASHEAICGCIVKVQASVLGRRSDALTPLYVLRCSAAGWSSGPDRGFHRLALRFNPGPRR